MTRRRLLLALVTLATCLGSFGLASPADAQQPAAPRRIGVLLGAFSPESNEAQQFRQGLLDAGYSEGRDVVIEYRSAEGRFEALPELAEELVRLKVDVIVAPTRPVARAAKAATGSIPIVFTIVSGPVGSGLVTSLSHPGGNITGMTDMGVDLAGKQLDLLRQLVPRPARVGTLGQPADKVWEPYWREARAPARRLHIEIIPAPITAPSEPDAAFAKLSRRVQALLVAPQAIFSVHRRRVIELELLMRLPAIHELRTFPEAGALMSYGPNYPALLRKTARHVDKVLKGARPADIPVEQPTEFELVINFKTAKALGVTIPQELLYRADEVIR